MKKSIYIVIPFSSTQETNEEKISRAQNICKEIGKKTGYFCGYLISDTVYLPISLGMDYFKILKISRNHGKK